MGGNKVWECKEMIHVLQTDLLQQQGRFMELKTDNNPDKAFSPDSDWSAQMNQIKCQLFYTFSVSFVNFFPALHILSVWSTFGRPAPFLQLPPQRSLFTPKHSVMWKVKNGGDDVCSCEWASAAARKITYKDRFDPRPFLSSYLIWPPRRMS